jgi:CRP-like cAMP-binding protein
MQQFVDRLLERSSLDRAATDALLAVPGRCLQIRAHVDIVAPGEAPTAAFLVLDGLVGRFGQVVDGRRQITGLHIPGDMCNLPALVVPSGSAYQALAASTIFRIANRDLSVLLRDHPLIGVAFWRACAVEASILAQWLVNIGRRNAQSRLAHLLCEMAVRMEEAKLGTRGAFTLDASQNALGDALGLTAVHVNRTLRALREQGLVAIDGRSVHIPNWAGLATLGEFDETYLLPGMRANAAIERPWVPA